MWERRVIKRSARSTLKVLDDVRAGARQLAGLNRRLVDECANRVAPATVEIAKVAVGTLSAFVDNQEFWDEAQSQPIRLPADVVGLQLLHAAYHELLNDLPIWIPTAYQWVYKGAGYETPFSATSEEHERLLVLQASRKATAELERLRASVEGSSDSVRRQPIPELVRAAVWRRDGGQCARCGSRERLEFDHIVPVALGGSNTARNIELLCEHCNREKGAAIR